MLQSVCFGNICLKFPRVANTAVILRDRHNHDRKKSEACCSSPAAIRYWFAMSLGSWAVLSLVGVYWHPLRAWGAPTILLAIAIGCFANWIKNRTLHCGITGPLFLVVAVLLLLSETRIIEIGSGFMWPTILLGSGIAFLLEWRYTSHTE